MQQPIVHREIAVPSSIAGNASSLALRHQPYSMSDDMTPHLETRGLLDYLRILFRNKGIILAIATVGMLLAVLITLPQVPLYRARATVEIQGVNNEFLNTKQAANDDGSNSSIMADIQTQIKILDSEFLIDRVIDRLKSEGKLSDQAPAGKRTFLQRLLKPTNPAHSDTADEFHKSAFKRLTVSQISQTRVIEVTFQATNPKLAAEFVNELNAEYVESNMESRWKVNEQTSKWLSHQIDDQLVLLERSELKLQNYARQAGLLFNSSDTNQNNVSEQRLEQIQAALSRAQEARAQAQARFEMATTSPASDLADIVNDPSIHDLDHQLTELRRQEAELASIYSPKYDKLVRLRAQIAPLQTVSESRRKAVLNRIQNDYETSRHAERLLQSAYSNQAEVMLDQNDKSIQYNILKRDVETNRQLYESMLQNVKAATVASAFRTSNVRIVDPAKVPDAPYSPNIKINAALGFIGGLIIGATIVLIRTNTDDTLKNPGEVSLWARVPEIGVIPRRSNELRESTLFLPFPRSWRKQISGGVDAGGPGFKPSAIPDAFRTIILSMLFAGEDDMRPRLLVISSSGSGEGKTTVTANLAIALAEIRQKVLIIDADLRKPQMHWLFGVENDRGLSTILAQGDLSPQALNEYIQPTSVPGIHLLPSGRPTNIAANLLHSRSMKSLLETVRGDYDMILIDTPPASQLPDARILGRLSDAVILVTRAGLTTREAASAVAAKFMEDHTPLLGAILNDCDTTQSGKKRQLYPYEELPVNVMDSSVDDLGRGR